MKLSRLARITSLVAAFGVFAFVVVSVFFAIRFTGPNRRALRDRPEAFLQTFETVRFRARDGVELSGWFGASPGAKQAVVLLHGFGSTRVQMLARAGLLQSHGYAVLLYDARGHGLSGGDRVSFGWYETRDLLGALDFLRDRGFREFGCIGASQGGATIALAAAELHDVHWVVLESVYPTLTDAVDRRFRRTFGIPGWLGASLMTPLAEHRLGINVRDVAPLEYIGRLPCPVLIAHGDRDTHTLPTAAHAFFARAHEPKSLWIVSNVAHEDLYGRARADYEAHLFGFLASVQARDVSLATDHARPPP